MRPRSCLPLSLVGAALLLLTACSDSPPADEPPPPDPDGCAEDELSLGGSCFRPGIAEDACAAGFEWADSACHAILPDSCPPATMARIGELGCVEVGTGCGEGTWGAIVVEPTTVYADATASAAGADGSAAQPFVTIGEAVAAAAPGAIVAIAEGSYNESVQLSAHPVRLWGRCPQLVQIVGGTGPAVVVTAAATGSEIRNVALTAGGDPALSIVGALGVFVGDSWIHDGDGWGIEANATLGDTSVTVERTLVERVTQAGIYGEGATLLVRDSEVREMVAHSQGQGFGIAVFPQVDTARRSTLELDHVVVRDAKDAALNLIGSDVVMRGSVVQRVEPTDDPAWGIGVSIQLSVALWDRANVVIEQSEISHTKNAGVLAIGSDVAVVTTSVHDIATGADGTLGRGIEVEEHAEGAEVAQAVMSVSDSTIRRVFDSGVMVFGSQATLERVLIQDVAPSSEERGGTGAWAQPGFVTGDVPSLMTVRQSLVERVHHAGVGAYFSGLVVDRLVARDVWANPNGTHGDGIMIAGHELSLSHSQVLGSARVGVASFGGRASVESSELRCNAIDLSAQDYDGLPAEVIDQGGNRCGCDGTDEPCQAINAGLEPPSPL